MSPALTPAQAKSFWTKVLKSLEQKIQWPMFITWFKETAVLGQEEEKLIIGLPYPIFLNWHLEHYRSLTLAAAKLIDPKISEVVYQVDNSLSQSADRTVDLGQLFPERKMRKLPRSSEVRTGDGLRGQLLNSRYTLESFIVGPSNRLAHAASMAVVSHPGDKYNPLFIWGGVGLGKTHLLQAAGNGLLQGNPSAVVLYVTSEEFTNQVIEAIRMKKMEQLRRRFRRVDMLIIDDIQFFAGKERCQEEFFHTFNALAESGKQVVISSDRSPRELHALPDRLRSRLERGMVADVRMPDYETRVAILSERAQEYELFLDSRVIEFIAEHVTDSVRSLEGILMQAVAQYELEQRVPTVSSIAEIMVKLSQDPSVREEEIGFEHPPKRRPRLEDIMEGVSTYYSIPIQEIIGSSRARSVLIPRQVAMYIARKRLGMSTTTIGSRFSGRDHSTVLNSVSKIDQKVREDHQLLREIRAIEEEVGVR